MLCGYCGETVSAAARVEGLGRDREDSLTSAEKDCTADCDGLAPKGLDYVNRRKDEPQTMGDGSLRLLFRDFTKGVEL